MKKGTGMFIFLGAGAILWFFMMSSFYQWWDVGGIVAGFILAPGVILFPLLHWFMEGVFPTFYFVIWGIGMAGLVYAGLEGED